MNKMIREFAEDPNVSWWERIHYNDNKYKFLWTYALDISLAVFFSILFFFSALAGIWGGSLQWGLTSVLSCVLGIALWFVVAFRRD